MDYTANLIPTMTSNTTPSGVVIYGHQYSPYLPYMAFDKSVSSSSFWSTGIIGTGVNTYIGYQFTSGKTIKQYTIKVRSDDLTYAPSAWQFQGSNNGTTWTILDTQTLQTWSLGQIKTYNSFNNNTSYTYYRLFLTTGTNGGFTISEIEMMEQNIIKRSLVQDGNDNETSSIKYYLSGWQTVLGKSLNTLTESDYTTYGMIDSVISSIIPAQWSSLINASTASLLTYVNDTSITGYDLKETAVPQNQLAVANGDLDLSNVANVRGFTIIGTNVRIVFSNDSGETWYKFNSTSNSFEPVVLTGESVYTNGNSLTEYNAITSEKWNEFLVTKKIRHAYLLSQNSTNDSSYTDSIQIAVDYNGGWQGAVHGTEYTYYYETIDGHNKLNITLTGMAGTDVKINYTI